MDGTELRTAANSEPPNPLLAFIAYARGDGVEGFITQLQRRLRGWGVGSWYDEQRRPGEWFTEAISRELVGSDVLLYVMSPRSVRDDKFCQLELLHAADHGIPIIGLRTREDIKTPLLMRANPPIPFHDRARGGKDPWRDLEEQLTWLSSWDGQIYLREQKLRVLEQESQTYPQARVRFEARITTAERALAELRQRAADPLDAVRRRRREIDADLERDRASKGLDQRLGGPPYVGTPPAVLGEFRDRSSETGYLERHLTEDRTRMVSLVGPSGIGKTAIVDRLWRRARQGRSALRDHALIYLSAHDVRPVTAAAVVGAFLRLVSDEQDAGRLLILVKDQRPWVEKLVAVLEALRGRPSLLAIDGLEQLLDDNRDLADPALREVVEHLIVGGPVQVKVLLVGRTRAEIVKAGPRDLVYTRDLTEGLPLDDAVRMLQAMDADDVVGLRSARTDDLAWLHRLTGGSPRALELAFGLLLDRPELDVGRLVTLLQDSDARNPELRLFAWAFEGLDRDERLIVQALAVYRRPVRASAVDDLLSRHTPGLDSRPMLEDLCERRVIRRDGPLFYLPPAPESDEVLATIPSGGGAGTTDDQWEYTQPALFRRAADHVAQTKVQNPQEVADLADHLSEVDLRVRAGESERAFTLMSELDEDYLLRWGYRAALVPSLLLLLKDQGLGPELRIDALSLLTLALLQQDERGRAVPYVREAIELVPRHLVYTRIVLHQQLSGLHMGLDELEPARRHIASARRLVLRYAACAPPGDALVALGSTLADQAHVEASTGVLAPSARRLAVAITLLNRSKGNERQLYIAALLTAAWISRLLGDHELTRQRNRAAQGEAEKLGQERQWGKALLSEAELLLDEGHWRQAADLAQDAADVGVVRGSRELCRDAKYLLALASLCLGDDVAAQSAVQMAERHRGSVAVAAVAGLVAFRQGDHDAAREAFSVGAREAESRRRGNERNFQLLDHEGLVAGGLALLGHRECLDVAVASYRAARHCTRARGVVGRNLLLLEQFGPEADSRTLEVLLAAAAGARPQ